MPPTQLMFCAHCGTPFAPKVDPLGRGRPARYCGAKCRSYASRERKKTTWRNS